MTFLYRGVPSAARIALFPGAWNPPTIAHLAIAQAARAHADEVIWVVPRAFPHKEFEGASFEDRCRMIERIARKHAGHSAAISEGGLYFEMADEARALLGDETEIAIVCGRDAAERVAGWNYDRPDAFDCLLQRHRLLVAGRAGEYQPMARHAGRIIALAMESSWDEVSSSEVRRRILAGEVSPALVPPELASMVTVLYRRK